MGLAPLFLKAIQKKGFKLPTPIQRKCIPPLLDGRDVVGMARTGSGKTAAFVLPVLQALRVHSIKVGIRGLILSPSRELALQTYGVIKEMSKFTDLRSMVLIGGDNVEEQFVQLATNPDIVVATPGRLMHVCVESRLSLKEVQFVVWDEADRLIEDPTMALQMKEISARLPEARQTALFSATLPKALAEFAQAGLRNPLLIRLDADGKLSPDLKLSFVSVKSDQKDAALLFFLGKVIPKEGQFTVIFTATKHHVEYLQELLTEFNFPCTYIYGSLDQTARKLAIEQFRRGRKPILIVTDVAARGIDIPLLDNVINYDFPPTPKLFIHRVGRVARAGRQGHAYSLVSPDELCYLFDLQLFLGKTIQSAREQNISSECDTLCLGDIPQSLLDEEQDSLTKKFSTKGALGDLKGVMLNGYKLYRRTRPAAAPESHRRSKEFFEKNPILGSHPMFNYLLSNEAIQQAAMIQTIHNFRPRSNHLLFAKPALNFKSKGSQRTSNTVDTTTRDGEYYLKYTKDDAHKESVFALNNSRSFAEQARNAILDLSATSTMDDPVRNHRKQGRNRSDGDIRSKILKTEFGTKISSSFKSDIYEKWRAKTHLDIQNPGELEIETASSRARAILSSTEERKKWRNQKKRVSNKSKNSK